MGCWRRWGEAMTIYSLPAGWRLCKVGEVAELIGGGTPSRKQPDYFKGHIPWITGYDISETEPVLQSAREYITQEAIENSATRLIPKGQVLLTTRVTVGKVVIVGFDVCISQDIQGVICSEDVLSEYMYYFLLSQRERMVALQRGTTIKGVPKGVVQSLEIPLPPLPIQRLIVDILERADELRRKRAQADELTQRILSALFVKMFGDPATNPMGWPQSTIGQLGAYVTSGATPRGGSENYRTSGIPFIRSQNVLMNKLSLEDVACISTEIHERMKRSQVQPSDVLLNITGASIGRVAWVPDEVQEANVNQHVCIIRISHDDVLAPFVSFLLSTSFGQDQILRIQSGSTRQALNHEQVRSLELLLPSLDLQRQFAQSVSAIEAQLDQQVKARDTLDTLFEALLARAFRGELTAGLTLQEAFGLTERQMALLRLLSSAAQVREPVLVTSAMKYTFLFQMEGTQAGQPVERIAAEPRAPYATEPAYDFVPYKYGPFAKELYDDLETLEAAGLVKSEHSPKSKGALRGKTEIYLVQSQTAAIHDLGDNLPSEARQAADAVIGQYGNLSQKQLLDLVYQRYPEYAINSQRRGKG